VDIVQTKEIKNEIFNCNTESKRLSGAIKMNFYYYFPYLFVSLSFVKEKKKSASAKGCRGCNKKHKFLAKGEVKEKVMQTVAPPAPLSLSVKKRRKKIMKFLIAVNTIITSLLQLKIMK